MTSLRYVLVDVFSDRPLTGNPLAVFTRATGLPPGQMQAIAREMNLSETVFVVPPERGGHARVHIYTPRTELPFAGHPVLGTACVLGGPLQAETVRLETGRGLVDVRLEREGAKIVFGWMQQPLPTVAALQEAAPLLEALGGVEATLPIELYDNGARCLMVQVASSDTVRSLRPDFTALARQPTGVYVFARGGLEVKARMFAPSLGVNEDPATGSAAGPLAWHLVRHGHLEAGATLRIRQGEEIQRPSQLWARVEGDASDPSGIVVGGAAVVMGRGELVL